MLTHDDLRAWFGRSAHQPFVHVAYEAGFIPSDATWRTPGDVSDNYDFGDLLLAAVGTGVDSVDELERRLGQAVEKASDFVRLRGCIEECGATPVAMPHDVIAWLLLLADPRGGRLVVESLSYDHFVSYALLDVHTSKWAPALPSLPDDVSVHFPGS